MISWMLTPIGFKLLHTFSIYDKPNSRKIHKDSILTGGGLIIFISFLSSFFFSFYSLNFLFDNIISLEKIGINKNQYYSFLNQISFFNLNFIRPFLAGFCILFFMGILDDKFNLNSKLKFLIQIVSCSIFIVFSGYDISFSFLFGENNILSFILTLLFMLSLINAFNLIDGLDGLASGVSLITFISISLLIDVFSLNLLIYTFIGVLFAFLIHNSYPAKIFLGDSGSYILGYSISVFIILIGNQVSFQGWNISYLLILIGIPAIDIIYAFLRRLFGGKNIFVADRKHIHHLILDLGFSHKNSVLILYYCHSFLCIIGLYFLDIKLDSSLTIFLLPTFYLFKVYLLPKQYLTYLKLDTLKNKLISFPSTFIIVFILLFFIIKMINNSPFINYNKFLINDEAILLDLSYLSYYSFIMIFLSSIFLTTVSIFKKLIGNFSLILFSSIIALDFNSYPYQWVDFISLYLWYILIFVLIIFLIQRSGEDKVISLFTLKDYLIFFFLMIISMSSQIDFINIIYLSKIYLIYLSSRILFCDPVIRKYRLVHFINLFSLILFLFVL